MRTAKHVPAARRNLTPLLDPLQVKIRLLERGETLRSWALRNGWEVSTVWRTVNLGRRGGVSRVIAEQLKEELGL